MHPVCMYDALFPGMVVDELEVAGYGARPWTIQGDGEGNLSLLRSESNLSEPNF